MTFRNARRRLALAAGAILLLAGTAFAAPPTSVTITNFAFDPSILTIAPGTRVVWTNHDDEPHTIASADKATPFKSKGLNTDDTFAFTFDKAGTYKYFCSIHPHMVGQVVVK